MIREAINKELKRRGWTAYQLIKAAGVSPDPVYKFLAGERECTTATLEPILRVLEFKLHAAHH